MLTNTSFHSRSNTKRLMDTAKVVVHMKQRERVNMVVELLREGIGQSGEPTHIHSHVQILPLNVACAYVLRIGVANNGLLLATDASSRAVSPLTFRVVSVDFNQLGVINAIAERICDSGQVHLVPVSGQLDAISKPGLHVLQERRSGSRIAVSGQPADDKLTLRFNRREGPNVASITAILKHLRLDVLLLGIAKAPNLIDLNALARQVAKNAILILGARRANLGEKTKDRPFRYARHAGRGANGATFDQSRDNRCFLRKWQPIHGSSITERFSMSRENRRETLLFLGLFCLLGVRPSLLCGKLADLASSLWGHCFHAAFTTDSAAFAAHLGHDERDSGAADRYFQFGFGSLDCFVKDSLGILNNIKTFIRALGGFTTALWHTSSVARPAEACQAGGISN